MEGTVYIYIYIYIYMCVCVCVCVCIVFSHVATICINTYMGTCMLRLRKIKEKSPTPWYNEHTRTLKRAARKMERSWRKTKLEVFRLAWRESTLSYRKALKTATSDYFSSLLEQNKHNPRYLFNTVAKLTKNKASTGVDISQQHSSNDFMNYFTSKLILLEIKL